MEKMARYSVNRVKEKTTAGQALWLVAILMIIWLSGCRVENHEPYGYDPLFSGQIISNRFADGDISFSPPDTYYVSSARTTGSVLVGIDPFYQDDEFRGFLNFDLRGVHGVPWYALIESARVEIFINGVIGSLPGAGVPLIIDLVAYDPPDLIAGDFHSSNLPPQMRLPVDIYPYDTGAIVAIDVTRFLEEAQSLGLPHLQLRFLLDDFAEYGLVEIDDAAVSTAPLLTVFYY